MIIGIDCSTSVTAICILDTTGKIINIDALDFTNKKKFPTLFSKAQAIEDFFIKLKNQYSVDKITIEAALLGFRPGMSSATTISALQRFNGIVSWLCYKTFNMEPLYLSATSARKICGISIKKGVKAKLVVMEHLIVNEPQFLPYVMYTRTGSIKTSCYDKADSYIIAKASLTLPSE